MLNCSNSLKLYSPIFEKNGLSIGTINDGVASIRFDATRIPTCFEPGSVPISSFVNLTLKRSKVHTIVITDEASGLTYSTSYSSFQHHRRETALRSGKYFLLPLTACTPVVCDSGEN